MEIPVTTLIIAFIGGILPTLIWLWFFLKEDDRRPEPKWLVFLVFLAGMASVMVALPVEQGIMKLSNRLGWTESATWLATLAPIILFALTEELSKFFAARLTALRSIFYDEPIDAMIYLITAALGFATMENFLYVFSYLSDFMPLRDVLLNAQLRLLGATLLHVVASASIGCAIALTYYLCPHRKRSYLFIGILTAALLHALFNFLIMEAQGNNAEVFKVFGYFWLLAIVIIFLFETVKRIKKTSYVEEKSWHIF